MPRLFTRRSGVDLVRAAATVVVSGAALLMAAPAHGQSWEFVDGPPISCDSFRFYGPESAMMHGTAHFEGIGNSLEGILRTTDGGSNWEQLSTPESFDLFQVEFFGSQIMIANGTDTSGSPTDWGPAMYRSEDGGQNWEAITHPSEGSGTMYFDDPDTGTFIAPNDGGIWSTTDGGRTWTEGGDPRPDYEQSVRDAWEASGGSGFFVPSGQTIRGERAVYSAQSNYATTLDAGASWSFFDIAETGVDAASGLLAGDFASDSVIYGFTGTTQSTDPVHSMDGGVTWEATGWNPPPDVGFKMDNRCIQALAEGLAYAATDQSSLDPQPLVRLGDPSAVDVPDLNPWDGDGGGANNGGANNGGANNGGANNGGTTGGTNGGSGEMPADDDDGGCSVAASSSTLDPWIVLVGLALIGLRRRR